MVKDCSQIINLSNKLERHKEKRGEKRKGKHKGSGAKEPLTRSWREMKLNFLLQSKITAVLPVSKA